MRRTIVALKYAKGLFLVAKELGKFKQFAEELQKVKLLLDSIPEAFSALQNPIYPPDLKMEIVNELLKVLALDPELERFLRMLVEKRRIQYIDEIIRVYNELIDEELNIARGELITAYPIEEEDRKELEKILSKFLKKEVYLESKVDESIIGGVKIKIGDLVFDGSLKTQLRKIKETIKGEVLL